MKKAILASFILAFSLSITASASGDSYTAQSYYPKAPIGEVYVNGSMLYPQIYSDAYCQFLNYENATYIPLEIACEMLGASWVEDVGLYLTRGEEPFYRSYADIIERPETEEEKAFRIAELEREREEGFTITVHPDLPVYLDEEPWAFATVSGEKLPVISFKGEYYMPLRSVGYACELLVLYLPSISGNVDYSSGLDLDLYADDSSGFDVAFYTYLLTVPSEEELAEGKEQVEKVASLYGKLMSAIIALEQMENPTEEALGEIDAIVSEMTSYCALGTPAFAPIWDVICATLPSLPQGDSYYNYFMSHGTERMAMFRLKSYLLAAPVYLEALEEAMVAQGWT